MKSIIFTLLIVAIYMALADPLGEGGRIASGVLFQKSDVPELCSIDIDFENKYMFCSCVIINADWIITSLHCVYDTRELFGTVYVSAGTQKVKGIKTIGVVDLQIGFVKVETSFIKSATLDFAQFSSTLEDGTTHIDKTLLVCGYGVVDNKRTRYVEPHCTEMNIKKPETCSLTVTSSMLCGSWDNKDSNVCIGDSGGALYTKTTDSNKRRMLVGISILSLDIRGNANCLDGHKTIFYHAGKFGSAILQTVDAYNTKYNENKLIFPVLQI